MSGAEMSLLKGFLLTSAVFSVHGLRAHSVSVKFRSYYDEWLNFQKTYDKRYEDRETEKRRFHVFQSNLRHIEQHNQQYQQGNKTFYLGVNAFADLTHDEFVKRMRLDVLMRHGTGNATKYFGASFIQLPNTVDWRTKGFVTPIKNQGQCGSCWSFSTTGSMEGQHFRKTGKLVSLSEQQLIDCSVTYGDHGCDGGLMDYAFKYIRDKGIESEASYPYMAQQNNCQYEASLVVAHCKGYVDVSRTEASLKSAVGTVGPVSVAIDANHKSFQLYKGGVYDEPKCSSTRLDHGVLAVGYGTDPSGGDYWLVKNSWGHMWGEEGYIRMSRNKDNQCGIASQASYPLV